MACCLGSFPIDATIISRVPDFQHTWKELKESLLDCAEKYWEIRGKTTFEKILILGEMKVSKNKLLVCITERQRVFSDSNPSLPITSIIHNPGVKLEDIPLVVGKFRRLLRKNVKIGRSQILLYPECLERSQDSNMYKKTISAVREKTLLHALQHQNTALFREELKKILREWESLA